MYGEDDDNDDLAVLSEYATIPAKDGEIDATVIPAGIVWPSRSKALSRSALFGLNFEKGQGNAREHMRRMLSPERDLRGCPCMSCRRTPGLGSKGSRFGGV